MSSKHKEIDGEEAGEPMTSEQLDALFNSKEWREMQSMVEEIEKQMEVTNLVPIDQKAERYIFDRYPIAVLFARADLQEIAHSNFDEMLTEEEIQSVRDAFFDDLPYEVHQAVANAIEHVLDQREKREQTQ
jgi:hypothetical protein